MSRVGGHFPGHLPRVALTARPPAALEFAPGGRWVPEAIDYTATN